MTIKLFVVTWDNFLLIIKSRCSCSEQNCTEFQSDKAKITRTVYLMKNRDLLHEYEKTIKQKVDLNAIEHKGF